MNFSISKTALLALLVLMVFSAGAQVPQKFNYQAVIRDGNGQPLINKTIKLRLRIVNGGQIVTTYYTETRTLTTNDFGMVSVAVGSAGADAYQGSVGSVPWSGGNRFLVVEVDHDNDGVFTSLGSSEIISTPYALHAAPVGSAGGDLGGSYPNPVLNKLQGQVLDMSGTKYDGYAIKWDAGQSKWMPARDQDGGPDYYFRVTRNYQEGVEIKPTYDGTFYFFANDNMPSWGEKQITTFRYRHEEADEYGVFNDSIFTAPSSGYYEFEAHLRFHQFFKDASINDTLAISKLAPTMQFWLGLVKNSTEIVGYTIEYFPDKIIPLTTPVHVKKAVYLQAGDIIKVKATHNWSYNKVVLGYVEVPQPSSGYYREINWGTLYFTGKRLR